MKRNYLLLLFILACLSVLSGSLTAGVSLVGKVGITFFYEQLSFFKSWWQSALVCMGAMLVILLVLWLIDKVLKGLQRKAVLLIFFFLFLTGLYFTFKDFRNDFSYRLLGERFHLGIYLYWMGFCIISLFFALTVKNKPTTIDDQPEAIL